MYLIYIFLFLISISFITITYSHRSKIILQLLWIILFVISGTFGYFTDDYEPYVEIVNNAYINPLAHFHIEPLWIWLAEVCKGDITYFRLFSFSILVILLLIMSYIYNINNQYLFAYYSLICLQTHLCWVRQPIAMTLFLIAFALIFKKSYVIAFLCLIGTFFVHKIGIIMILLLPFIFIKINKRNIFILFSLIPLFYFFIYYIISVGDYAIINIFNEYGKADGSFSKRHIIYTIFNNVSLFTNLILLAVVIYRYYRTSYGIYNYIMRYLFGVYYITMLLLFMPIQTDVMITRSLSIANFILVIILAHNISSCIMKRCNKWIALLLVILIGVREFGLIANNNTRIYRLTKPLF